MLQRWLQSTVAFSFAHSKNIPAIFLCREYTSSGGGTNLCLIITGTKLFIFRVVVCFPKLKGVTLANGSPSAITASTCASFITFDKENYIMELYKPISQMQGNLGTELMRNCQNTVATGSLFKHSWGYCKDQSTRLYVKLPYIS